MLQISFQSLLSADSNLLRKIVLFFLGIFISIISFLIIFSIKYSSYQYQWNEQFNFIVLIKSISYCLIVAIIEEYFFRYLFLRKWIKDSKKKFSKNVIYLGIMSSLIFGFLHLDLAEFPKLQIYLTLSGLSYFFGTFRFRTIFISIGMHFSWNLIQGVIFPFEGSGSDLLSLLSIDSSLIIKPETNNFILLSISIEFLLIYFFY